MANIEERLTHLEKSSGKYAEVVEAAAKSYIQLAEKSGQENSARIRELELDLAKLNARQDVPTETDGSVRVCKAEIEEARRNAERIQQEAANNSERIRKLELEITKWRAYGVAVSILLSLTASFLGVKIHEVPQITEDLVNRNLQDGTVTAMRKLATENCASISNLVITAESQVNGISNRYQIVKSNGDLVALNQRIVGQSTEFKQTADELNSRVTNMAARLSSIEQYNSQFFSSDLGNGSESSTAFQHRIIIGDIAIIYGRVDLTKVDPSSPQQYIKFAIPFENDNIAVEISTETATNYNGCHISDISKAGFLVTFDQGSKYTVPGNFIHRYIAIGTAKKRQ
jgi:hypothetical protein